MKVYWLTSPIAIRHPDGSLPAFERPRPNPLRMAASTPGGRGGGFERPDDLTVIDLADYLRLDPRRRDGPLRPDGIRLTWDAATAVSSDWLGPAILRQYLADGARRRLFGGDATTTTTTAPPPHRHGCWSRPRRWGMTRWPSRARRGAGGVAFGRPRARAPDAAPAAAGVARPAVVTADADAPCAYWSSATGGTVRAGPGRLLRRPHEADRRVRAWSRPRPGPARPRVATRLRPAGSRSSSVGAMAVARDQLRPAPPPRRAVHHAIAVVEELTVDVVQRVGLIIDGGRRPRSP